MTSTLARLTAALTDRYRVDRELGAGGMATVYLAHDLRHERDVAIKVLHPDLGAALGAERFLAEIKTTAKLQHPHILPLLDSGAADGLLYYVMPFVRGETLRARLERERQLAIPDALRIAREVAGALDHAHKQGIIHRDIKPENILLQDGAAVVADFGIALAVQSAGGARMTQTGLSLGTPQYMSPEQAMGERTIDARSDIYALGAVTYEMLTGEPPFTGATTQAIVAKVLTERPVPLRTLRDTIAPSIEAAVSSALAKLPADRPASAAEFAARCDATVRETAALAVGEDSALHKRRVGPVLAGIGVGLALATAIWFTVGTSAPSEQPVTRFAIEESPSISLQAVASKTFAFDPASQNLFYVISVDGTTPGMVRRPLDLADEVVVPSSSNILNNFALSPDGRELVASDGQTVRRRIIAGKSEQTLPLPVSAGASGVAWASADLIVLTVDSASHMIAVDLKTGQTRAVFDLPKGTRLRWPVAVAGADRVVFTAYSPTTDSAVLMSGRLSDGRAQRVDAAGVMAVGVADGMLVSIDNKGQLWGRAFDPEQGKASGPSSVVGAGVMMAASGLSLGYATMSPRGDLAYFDAGDRSVLELVEASGRRSLAVTDTLSFDHPRWSPDGERLVVTVTDAASRQKRVWIADRVSGQFSPMLPNDNAETDRASFAVSGKEVLYRRVAGGRLQYFAHALDGRSPDAPISPHAAVAFEAELSPDGQTMLGRLAVGEEGQRLWTWNRGDTAGTALRPYSDVRASMGGPRISPDGRWAAFEYAEPGTTSARVWVTAFPVAAQRWQLGKEANAKPVWSGNGRTLFSATRDGLFAADLALGERVVPSAWRKVLDGPLLFDQNARAQLDVARDGRIVYVRPIRGHRIIVVRNFIAEAKAKMREEAR